MVEREKSASVEAICNRPARSAGQEADFCGCLRVVCGSTEHNEWESVLTASDDRWGLKEGVNGESRPRGNARAQPAFRRAPTLREQGARPTAAVLSHAPIRSILAAPKAFGSAHSMCRTSTVARRPLHISEHAAAVVPNMLELWR